MRKLLLVIIILLIGIGLFAQISTQRVVNIRITSAAAVGVAPADTFNVVATVKTDQLGQGYNGSQIDTADILVDQLGRQFEVYSITTQAPGSITFRVFQLQAANIAPFGNGVVQAPTGGGVRLLVPDNDNGITSALYARIINHNTNRLDSLISEQSDDQTAAEVPFTPASTIIATDVQAAIEEALNDANSYADANDSDTIDSTRLSQDSILIYYQAGIEIDRDTIRGSGSGGSGSTETADGVTILGDGGGTPFAVDTALIATTQAVIDSIAALTITQTAAQIRDSLETLAGTNRVDVTAVKDARKPEYIDILWTGQSNMVNRDEAIGAWTYTTEARVQAFQFDTDGFEIADPALDNIIPASGSPERNNIAFRVGKNFARDNVIDTVRLVGYAQNGEKVERWTPATTGDSNETASGNYMLDSLINRLNRTPAGYLAKYIVVQQGETNTDTDNFLGKWEAVYDTLTSHSKVDPNAIMVLGRFNIDNVGAHLSIDSLSYGLRNTGGRPIFVNTVQVQAVNTIDGLHHTNEFIDVVGDSFYGQLTGPVQINRNGSGSYSYKLGLSQTGARFSAGAGAYNGYQQTGSNYSGGAGDELGYQNSGAVFSGGAGRRLGYQNTGANFSGGAGQFLGYQNSGSDFSGGAGYGLGQSNAGSLFSGGAGYQLGYQNTGATFSGGAGASLGYQNSGDNLSIGAGEQAAYQNVGDKVSGGGGFKMLYRNRGSNVMADGYQCFQQNNGEDAIALGYQAGQYNDSDSVVYAGFEAGIWEIDITKQVTTTQDQRSGNSITVSSTANLGSVGEYVNLKIGVVGDFTPNIAVPMTFQVVNATTITATYSTLAGSSTTDVLTITPVKKYNNSVAVGYKPVIDQRDQIVLGNANSTQLKAGKVKFNTSQTLTGSEDGYVWTYNNTAGQSSLVAPNTGTDDQTATEVSVAATPTNYTAGSANVEAHLIGIDSALNNTTWLKPELETGNDVEIEQLGDFILSETESDAYSTLNISPYAVGMEARNFESTVNSVPTFFIEYYSDPASTELIPKIGFERYGLSDIDTPIPLASGMVIGQFKLGLGALIQGVSTEEQDDVYGTKIEFYTTDNATATNDLRVTIDQDGAIIAGAYGSASTFTTGATAIAGFDNNGEITRGVGDVSITSTLYRNSGQTVGDFIGTGSPESVVSASVGSTYRRTDGGAGTSFYVKESGTGSTGWVGK